MFDLSPLQWIRLAGGLVSIRAKHNDDIATLKQDVPKAMNLAKDVMQLITTVSGDMPTPKPPASPKAAGPVSNPHKVSIHEAARRIEQHGVSDLDQQEFDRATRLFG